LVKVEFCSIMNIYVQRNIHDGADLKSMTILLLTVPLSCMKRYLNAEKRGYVDEDARHQAAS